MFKKEGTLLPQDILDNKTNIKVEFYICAKKLDFVQITKFLRITPTSIRKAEDFPIKDFAKDYWNFDIEYEESQDINEQLLKLFDVFKCKVDILNEICQKFNANCGVCVVINVKSDIFPAMRIENYFIEFLSSINATIDFDQYYWL